MNTTQKSVVLFGQTLLYNNNISFGVRLCRSQMARRRNINETEKENE
ncbi:hypothetical protein L0P74_09410 [Mediterraneibacter faecis]|nr:hypothetical protein [Mediterraneibacter faecis]MCG4536261.1 hypothetical protein [Mediterraneibacter faecis]